MEPRQFALFKRSLRAALVLLEEEIGREAESERRQALESIRRELVELNASDVRPSDASGHPARHGLKAHRLITNWGDDDPVKMAVLKVENLYLKRLP